MPIAAYYEDEDEDETRQHAARILRHLTREHLIKSGVDDEIIQNDERLDFLNVPLNSTNIVQIGRELRVIAEEFRKSKERERVLERAQHVDVDRINYDDFYQFLQELFSEGITRERIVVLLFFCSDVVARAYANPAANLRDLFNWFLQFIFDRVCNWVANYGGWSKLFGTFIPAISQIVFYCLGSMAFALYVYKRISS